MTKRKPLAINAPKFIFDDKKAACAEVDPELFFPQETEYWEGKITARYTNIAEAKKICSECPLKTPCLIYALENREQGIWGGTTEDNRTSMRRGISSGRIRYRS